MLVEEVFDSSAINVGVQYAIEHGYQVSVKAIELMKVVLRRRLLAKSPLLDFALVIQSIIEEKARSTSQESFAVDAYTISDQDLIKFEPVIFATGEPILVSSEATQTEGAGIEVVFDPSTTIETSGSEGFALLFRSRYEKLLRILRERPEARQLTNISRITTERGTTRICGLVLSKRSTKLGIELSLDDTTGRISALAVSEPAKRAASEVALDQGVMLELENKNGRVLIRSVVQPDLPIRVPVGSRKEAYAIFLSDLHIGSNKFLSGAFSRFLDWVNGRSSIEGEDEEILAHLKYIVVGGDIVDGVGVFPNQESELIETDIVKQYEMVAERLSQVPKRFAIVAIPGNHDSTRQALPQPTIDRKYTGALYKLENFTLLGDPCIVKLSGVNVLVYHGRSLDDVLATTPGLSYERPTEAMKVLLKARHLAPTFGSRTPIAPEREDHLVIEQPPDIFHAGHVHSVGVEKYKGTLMVNSGTWQAQTSYQANLGIMPTPGVVPIVNLATFQVTTREFLVSRN